MVDGGTKGGLKRERMKKPLSSAETSSNPTSGFVRVRAEEAENGIAYRFARAIRVSLFPPFLR